MLVILLVCVIVVGICQVGDYVTTNLAIKHGFNEANPLVRWMGMLQMKIVTMSVWLFVASYFLFVLQDIRLVILSTVMVMVVYIVVITRTLWLISRA